MHIVLLKKESFDAKNAMSSSKYIVTTCRMCAFKFIPDDGKKEPSKD